MHRAERPEGQPTRRPTPSGEAPPDWDALMGIFDIFERIAEQDPTKRAVAAATAREHLTFLASLGAPIPPDVHARLRRIRDWGE
jgi:hypothetical protein